LIKDKSKQPARTASTLHEDAQLEVGVAFLGDQFGNLGRRAVGEDQRGRHLVDG